MVNVILVGRRHDSNGNPVYVLHIPDHNNKIKGLRKLKDPHRYSIQSYSLENDLRNYVFKGKKVDLERVI